MVYAVNILLLGISLVFLRVNYTAGQGVAARGPDADAATLRRIRRYRSAFLIGIAGQVASLLLIVVHLIWITVLDGGAQASMACLALSLGLAALAGWAVWIGLVL